MEHRIKVEPDVGMMVPDQFVGAVWALKRIADGSGSIADIAELMLAANAADPDGDLVGAGEIERAIRTADAQAYAACVAGDLEEAHRFATMAGLLHAKFRVILAAKIPGGQS